MRSGIMMMPVWSILLLSFIYICAIGFTVWNNMLSHTFTLFGVSVANKSKGSRPAVKLKVIFVRVMMIIFTVLNFAAPVLMLTRPGTVRRFLLLETRGRFSCLLFDENFSGRRGAV